MKKQRQHYPMNYVAKTQVFPWILGYQQQHFGLSPTLAEIGLEFKRSKEWARLCLAELQKQKMVSITPKQSRGIIVRGDYINKNKPKKGKK